MSQVRSAYFLEEIKARRSNDQTPNQSSNCHEFILQYTSNSNHRSHISAFATRQKKIFLIKEKETIFLAHSPLYISKIQQARRTISEALKPRKTSHRGSNPDLWSVENDLFDKQREHYYVIVGKVLHDISPSINSIKCAIFGAQKGLNLNRFEPKRGIASGDPMRHCRAAKASLIILRCLVAQRTHLVNVFKV